MDLALSLGALFVAAFAQNMAFTAVSRSRNSGDPQYHRWCAVVSNGVWFVTQLFILSTMLPALMAGDWWKVAVTGLVYVVATTEGSVLMMKIMLKKETGKRKVGASG